MQNAISYVVWSNISRHSWDFHTKHKWFNQLYSSFSSHNVRQARVHISGSRLHVKANVSKPMPLEPTKRTSRHIGHKFDVSRGLWRKRERVTGSCTSWCNKKASSYIAQYPVLRTAQSALHFTSWQTCSLRHHLGFSEKHPDICYN